VTGDTHRVTGDTHHVTGDTHRMSTIATATAITTPEIAVPNLILSYPKTVQFCTSQQSADNPKPSLKHC